MNTTPDDSWAHPETRTMWPGWGAIRLASLSRGTYRLMTPDLDARRPANHPCRVDHGRIDDPEPPHTTTSRNRPPPTSP